MADDWIDDIYAFIEEGARVDVWVLSVGDNGRVDLTMIKNRLDAVLEVGRKFTGLVRKVVSYGAFVDIGTSRCGL
eukprot:3752798-Alexandrium_andersonii.AAC.1